MASRRDDRKEDEVGDMLSSLQARLAKAGMGAIAADMQGLLRETETRQEELLPSVPYVEDGITVDDDGNVQSRREAAKLKASQTMAMAREQR